MVEIKEKQIQSEFIEKLGKVMNAEESRLKDEKLQESEYRDFGQVDFADHEIEETIRRDNKINKAIKKSIL